MEGKRAIMRGPRVCKRADVAQLVEHSLGKGEVTSSILVISSRDTRDQGSGIRGQLGPWRESGFRLHEQTDPWPLNPDNCFTGGSNSVVESQPSKLLVASSILVSRSKV